MPYHEFIQAHEGSVCFHIPNHNIYPWFKEGLKANRHEYYRYRKSYVSRYNEENLARIFTYCAEHYDKKEDGRFSVSFRCTGMELANDLVEKLKNGKTYKRIVGKAMHLLSKNKNAVQLLNQEVEHFSIGNAPVVKIYYKQDIKK